MMEYKIVNDSESFFKTLNECREAQKVFATYTQEQVDKIFKAAALAANNARIKLAKLAVEETGMGIVEDKVIKNHYAAEYIYNAYKDTKTCGVIEEDEAYGIQKIAEPIGVVAAVIPTTNPTSTAIFKCLLALKTRNAIIISPHPRAKNSTIAAAKLILEAAVEAGRVLLFFVFSLLLSLANALLSIEKIHLALRYIFHYAISTFGFWVCFCVPNKMNFSRTLVGIVIFTLIYAIIMCIIGIFKRRFKKVQKSEKKYEKQFSVK